MADERGVAFDAPREEAQKREKARKERVVRMRRLAYHKKHTELMRKARNGEFACESGDCPGEHALAPPPCAADAHKFDGARWCPHCTVCGWPGSRKTQGGPIVPNKQGGTVLDRTTRLCTASRTQPQAPAVYVPPADLPPAADLPPGIPASPTSLVQLKERARARLVSGDSRIDPMELADLEDMYGQEDEDGW